MKGAQPGVGNDFREGSNQYESSRLTRRVAPCSPFRQQPAVGLEGPEPRRRQRCCGFVCVLANPRSLSPRADSGSCGVSVLDRRRASPVRTAFGCSWARIASGEPGTSLDEVMKRANQAMYQAKREGGIDQAEWDAFVAADTQRRPETPAEEDEQETSETTEPEAP